MVAGSGSWTDGGRYFAEKARVAGRVLCSAAGDGAAAGRVQLQLDHQDHDRHPGGNLYRDRERNFRFSHTNNRGAVYGGVGVVASWSPKTTNLIARSNVR